LTAQCIFRHDTDPFSRRAPDPETASLLTVMGRCPALGFSKVGLRRFEVIGKGIAYLPHVEGFEHRYLIEARKAGRKISAYLQSKVDALLEHDKNLEATDTICCKLQAHLACGTSDVQEIHVNSSEDGC
jgi:hypothetical protein